MDILSSGLAHRRDTGIFTASEAAAVGLRPYAIRLACRASHLKRLARGTYVDGTTWDNADSTRRHLLMATSQAMGLRTPLRHRIALSHHSAAARWDIPLLATPTVSHLIRRDIGGGHTRRGYTIHERYGDDQCPADPMELIDASATAVVKPVLAALGVAELSGFVAGVVALDGALHAGQTTPAEIQQWLDRLPHRNGMAAMRAAAMAATSLSESPLESQTRLVLQGLGYRPECQVSIHNADGTFAARVDLLIAELGVVVEADGRVKYDQANSTQVLVSEKRRESQLVDLGYAVVRVEHDQLADHRTLHELSLIHI